MSKFDLDDGFDEQESLERSYEDVDEGGRIGVTPQKQIEEYKEDISSSNYTEKEPENAPISSEKHNEILDENSKHREHNISLSKRIGRLEDYLNKNPIPTGDLKTKMNMRLPKMAIGMSLLISIVALIISLVRLS